METEAIAALLEDELAPRVTRADGRPIRWLALASAARHLLPAHYRAPAPARPTRARDTITRIRKALTRLRRHMHKLQNSDWLALADPATDDKLRGISRGTCPQASPDQYLDGLEGALVLFHAGALRVVEERAGKRGRSNGPSITRLRPVAAALQAVRTALAAREDTTILYLSVAADNHARPIPARIGAYPWLRYIDWLIAFVHSAEALAKDEVESQLDHEGGRKRDDRLHQAVMGLARAWKDHAHLKPTSFYDPTRDAPSSPFDRYCQLAFQHFLPEGEAPQWRALHEAVRATITNGPLPID